MQKLVFLSLLLLCFTACDNDDGDSDLDGSKDLNTLNTSEYKQLCEYADDALDFEKFKPLYCYYGAAIQKTQDSTINCSEVAQACIADPGGDFGGTALDCNEIRLSDLDSCTAAVSDVETCANDSLTLWESLNDGVNCENAIERFDSFESMSPMACTSLDMTCPDLFATDDDEF